MSIKKIDKNELRGYEGKEGLILQGCGGNPQEWVDGINDLFTRPFQVLCKFKKLI